MSREPYVGSSDIVDQHVRHPRLKSILDTAVITCNGCGIVSSTVHVYRTLLREIRWISAKHAVRIKQMPRNLDGETIIRL